MLRSFTFVLLIVALFPLLTVPLEAQDAEILLTPLESNPVLPRDETIDWEAGGLLSSVVHPLDGQWLMFYQGLNVDQSVWAVGIATSDDGVTWTRYADNPVFVADPATAKYGINTMTVFNDGAQWILLFTPQADSPRVDVLAATAPSPEGPWMMAADPALPRSGALDWDSGARWLSPVLATEDGYTLYFSSGSGGIGLMTSSDGLHWTRYDDPATATGRYAASDPVFEKNADFNAWDGASVAYPLVRRTAEGWEMFYSGEDTNLRGRIGYATSPDGVVWTRQSAEPLLTEEGSMWLVSTGLAEMEAGDILYYTGLPEMVPSRFLVEAAAISNP